MRKPPPQPITLTLKIIMRIILKPPTSIKLGPKPQRKKRYF